MSKYISAFFAHYNPLMHTETHTDTETLASPHILCYPKSICTLTDTCVRPRLLQTDILLQMQNIKSTNDTETHIVTLVQKKLPSIYEVLHV